ncbi:Dynamin-binding protein [Fulvia fulva]|uniref:Dynamin-binding protein n=1 Tax=Passalora fulva TaxID=5499 RepID=A0A9Q8P898_PASFU|nr:Dynamin-binding protein [Fulvia fulva]UJO16888.1 Dynamin-binding protein [Fulvia fulva]
MDHRSDTPPVLLSPNGAGPDLYMAAPDDVDVDPYHGLGATAGGAAAGAPALETGPFSAAASHAAARAATKQLRSASGSALNRVLLPTPGTVKDMRNRFDRSAAAGPGAQSQPPALSTSRDRYRRPTTASRNAQRSPTGGGTSEGETRRLQKRMPDNRLPRKSPSTSFELSNSSFSSGTSTGTMKTSRSQPHAAFSPKRAMSPSKHQYAGSRPLFGEITADGKWNGNFDLGNYGPLPTFQKAPRRGSESSIALGHGRSQSHQGISSPYLTQPPKQKLSHKRSRSDMDQMRPQVMPSMPNLSAQMMPGLYPTPPDSVDRHARYTNSPPPSRIPVSNRGMSDDSGASSNGYSRPPSVMSNPADRRRPAKSPSRTRPTTPSKGKENSNPNARSRYHPPMPSTPSGQTLSAKIVAPVPKTSPPLRSSRPRQPVSSATTSASRARAAERFHGPLNSNNSRDGRRPSEQWLGKPYDPPSERSRRTIPELNNVDFAERRERIQRAISQSLKSAESSESLKRSQSRSRSRGAASRAPSRSASNDHGQATRGADADTQRDGDQRQGKGGTFEMSRSAPDDTTAKHQSHARTLSVDTAGFAAPSVVSPEPLTGHTDRTMFEDESPVHGRPAADPATTAPKQEAEEPHMFLAPATYQLPSKPTAIDVTQDAPGQEVQSPSVLDNVMRMRERSPSTSSRTGTEFADESASADRSPSDLGDGWTLSGNGLNGDQGSIRIMLDDDPNLTAHAEHWSNDVDHHFEDAQQGDHSKTDAQAVQQYNHEAFTANGYMESPTEETETFLDDPAQVTPRRLPNRDDTLKPTVFNYEQAHGEDNHNANDTGTFASVLEYYRTTGTVTEEMLEELNTHNMVDLQRISANGGSNAHMIERLLDSIMGNRVPQERVSGKQLLEASTYEVPTVTPDTPPMADDFEPGHVIVYGSDVNTSHEEDDFQAKIRKADEDWARQQMGEDPFTRHHQEEDKPLPPPKDAGYTPRSSSGPVSTTFASGLSEGGLRISTIGALDMADIQAAGDLAAELTSPSSLVASALQTSAPPLPSYAPPPVPPDSASRIPFALPDMASAKAYSDRESSDLSPQYRKTNWGASESSRPSIDSQRMAMQLPGSQSMTSFATGESTRQASIDTCGDSQSRLTKTTSPGPEQKRLLKRRHIIKELLDTENSYHQDLKIIEDIYKATCTPELVAAEDKKVLFGNCDEIERFALSFYDELRKAATQVYVPPKQHRWLNKRGSFSTTQSDGTSQTSQQEGVDDEKDRTTTIGRTFLMNLAQMEQVYGAYLRNHDAANQRLSAIQNIMTVKCWLDECHANASDITAAWDLDSLLVKPTQRVAKYPMLLQQLLETTPADHPDHEDLKTAAKDAISMLTRINDAKKRADIVDQIVNPSKTRKESDIRSGLAKAFGRRTEKLKERVGIAEVFQDPEFDELAHKFGGHFIRLQICMRDVQDYVHRADKAIELVNSYATGLQLFIDLRTNPDTVAVSKWRRYGQVIHELATTAFNEHKADITKRVLAPMIQCIKLHEGPQNAINKRKRRIVDFAKCKSEERRGVKPDKKTVEASDQYVALNETLKIDLPKLYNLTAQLVQNTLHCFLDIQLKWHNTWERKLQPLLDAVDIPKSIQDIEPAFKPDYAEVEKSLHQLSICNGTLKIEAANFLSPTPTPYADDSTSRRPSNLDKRTLSVGSEASTAPNTRRHSGIYSTATDMMPLILNLDGRIRSNSSMSSRTAVSQTPASTQSNQRPWSNQQTPSSSFTTSRPTTANTPVITGAFPSFSRQSSDNQRVSRGSDATYFTPRPGKSEDNHRYSGLFNSALPPEVQVASQETASSSKAAPEDTEVMFVCASLFEFSIDKTRKEAGYPYLQYVQGEVFDVVAQKGELWLAKNQDDANNELGWIWEQHFIILSSES